IVLLVFLVLTSLPILVTPFVAQARGDSAGWAVMVPISVLAMASGIMLARLIRTIRRVGVQRSSMVEGGDERMDPFKVVICGAGVAGVEGLLRLRKLAGDRVDIALLSAKTEFSYRPIAVLEPFAKGKADRYSVARIAADTDARLIPHNLTWVNR